MLTTQTFSLFSRYCKLLLQTQPQPQHPFQPGGCPEAAMSGDSGTAPAAGDIWKSLSWLCPRQGRGSNF